MNKPSTFIYSGLFILLLGFGDDKAQLIPNEVVFTCGGLALAYGIFLRLKLDKKIIPGRSELEFDFRKLPAKVYLIIGIVFIRLNRFVDFIDQNQKLNMAVTIIGIAITFYGLNLFFREKRMKRGKRKY